MIEEILENLKEIVASPTFLLFGTITVIEVVPIKLNPWKWILGKIGDALNGDLRKELSEVNRELKELKRDFEETKAQNKRWNILDFARSCRKGEVHSREEWKHAISEIKDYEEYTAKKHINNGVIEEDSKYLRELYHERNIKNDFV